MQRWNNFKRFVKRTFFSAKGRFSEPRINKFLTKTPIFYESLISNDIKGVEISKSLGNDRGVLPFTVLIKPNGKIQEVFFGKLNMESLNKHLKDTIK